MKWFAETVLLTSIVACSWTAPVCAQQVLPSKSVTTIADWPCAEWKRRREAQERIDAPQMWLVGYLTGMASAYRADVLAHIDAPQIFSWTDAWCAGNEAAPLSAGAQVLFRQLLEVAARAAQPDAP